MKKYRKPWLSFLWSIRPLRSAARNTESIQAVLDSLGPGDEIHFIPGIYRLRGTLSVNKDVTLVGPRT